MRTLDGCSCRSIRNTIEDPWKSFDQDQESSRFIAYKFADSPCLGSHSLERGILHLLDDLYRDSLGSY